MTMEEEAFLHRGGFVLVLIEANKSMVDARYFVTILVYIGRWNLEFMYFG